ncbi:hypothetical protein DH2020_043743 [Rehmannia glutinosa]|uniref:Alcohol dehydrogenase n=1 Tax=Rehmannia glutinosa TaxID=99300 RepID=A0ABR0UK15_REHGL
MGSLGSHTYNYGDSISNDTIGKVITCKAAVAYGPGQALVVEEIRVDPPQKMENEAQRMYPRILGHEASGVVESVGEGVTDLETGDHVVPIFNGECQECRYCKSEKTNLCEKFRVNPIKSTMTNDGKCRFSSKDGKPIYHFLNTSTFSEYTVLDSACVVKIDQKAPLEKMTLLSCGVSTGLGAVWNTADVKAGATVAVFGLGAVGLAGQIKRKEKPQTGQISHPRGQENIMKDKRLTGKRSASPSLRSTPHSISAKTTPKTATTAIVTSKPASQVRKKPYRKRRSIHWNRRASDRRPWDLWSPAMVEDGQGWREDKVGEREGGVAAVVVEGARARGASRIIGVDINPHKRISGQAIGITDFINPKDLDKPVHEKIREMTEGGVDYSFECAGNLDVLREAFSSTHDEVKLDGFITHELPFSKINEALQLLIDGKSLRCLLYL